MATTVTKVVATSGGDYTSLSNWEAGQQGDLVAADEIRVAECHIDGADSTAVTINGWTTDATRYIKITVPAEHRHAGVRSTSKYKLTSPLFNYEEFVRVEGLQISVAGDRGLWSYSGTGADIRYSDCLLYNCGSDGAFVYSGNTTFINCVSMNNGGIGFKNHYGGTPTVRCYNCVAINNAGIGFDSTNAPTSSYFVAKNCYSGGNGGDDYSSAKVSKTTCHSEDATGDTQTAFSTSSGAYFTNVTAGSEDIHIGASSALINVGTDISADSYWTHPSGYVDIDGNARGTGANATDVGADEYVSAGGGPTIPVITSGF